MVEVSKKEKEAGIVPDPDVDTYMKVIKYEKVQLTILVIIFRTWPKVILSHLQAVSVEGQRRNLQTDYVLKVITIFFFLFECS